MRIIRILCAVLGFVIFSAMTTEEKYGFAYWDNTNGKNGSDKAIYLVVSDPVKNWFQSMTKAERTDWETDFRTEANRQAGFKLIESYDPIIPENGDFEKFSSLSEVKESIQNKVYDFKETYRDNWKNLPVKIIYVNLNKY